MTVRIKEDDPFASAFLGDVAKSLPRGPRVLHRVLRDSSGLRSQQELEVLVHEQVIVEIASHRRQRAVLRGHQGDGTR